jgi:hypothetical protein
MPRLLWGFDGGGLDGGAQRTRLITAVERAGSRERAGFERQRLLDDGRMAAKDWDGSAIAASAIVAG